MESKAHTSLATLAAPPTPSGGAGVLEVGQVHRPLLSTEEQVAAQFANGGAASVYRGQWLCCGAAFESKEGIVSLEGALGKAVDQGVLQGWKGKGERMKALKSNDGLLVGGVAIFKAPKTECFGDKAWYVAFGTKPAACVKIQMQKRIHAASSSSSSSSSSFSAAATTAAAAAAVPLPAVVGHLVGGGGEFENSNSKRRRASSGVDAAIAADQETEGKFEERIRGETARKAPPPATRQHGKNGRFLPHEQGMLQELAGAAATIMEQDGEIAEMGEQIRKLRERAVVAEVDAHTANKKVKRLQNEVNATQELLERTKKEAAVAVAKEKKGGSVRLGQATEGKSKLQVVYDMHVAKSTAKIQELKAAIAQLKIDQRQSSKEMKRKERQVAHVESKAASSAAALEADLAAAEANAERERQLREDLSGASTAKIQELKAAIAQLKIDQRQSSKEMKRNERQVAHVVSKAASSAAALEAELAAAEAKAERERQLREDLSDAYNDHSLLGAARKLLTGDELDEALRVPSLGAIGEKTKTMDELCARRKRDLGKVVSMLMGRVLQVAYCGEEKDPRKILEAALGRRDFHYTDLGIAMAEQGGLEKGKQAMLAVAAASYITCIRSGDDLGARRFLSSVVDLEGITEKEVSKVFSDLVPLEVGCRVRVASERNSKHYATLMATEDVNGRVLVSARRGPRGDLVEASEKLVDSNDVWHANSVRCTKGQVRAAKLHARAAFPGAEPEARKNPHSGISAERAAYVSNFLRRKDNATEVDGGMINAKKGVKYALTARRWRLWQKLVVEMKGKAMKPVSWSFFWALTSTAQYVLLKYDTCCCGICRQLGFDNYDELREIINELNSEIRRQTNDERGLPRLPQLLRRVDKEEDFRRGTYLTHLQNKSSCGSHCLQMLLSAHNEPAFRSPCQHEGPESGAGEVPKTMTQLVRDAHNRETKKSDWHHTCESCGAPRGRGGQSNVLMCTHCEAVVHPACLATWHNDQPGKGNDDTWTCPMCVRDIDQGLHAPGCSECDEAGYIASDVKLGIGMLAGLEDASSAASSPSPSSISSSSSSPSSFRRVAESEMLWARLESFLDKQSKYHGHLIQDRNQAVFKETVLQNMGTSSFYLLVDYWAKLGIVKAGGTACCEGDSVGISAHGSMFVYKNPTNMERKAISQQYKGVDWSEYPKPPDEGGAAYCEEHAAAYCDDAKQDQFHTKSVMQATTASFVKARPWLGRSRCSFAQSDNASNYRDPTIEVDCGQLGTRCFSVAGMGKDEGDGNGAVNKRQLSAMRDGPQGRAFMCATDYTAASKTLETTGQNYGELVIDRSSNVQVVDRKSFPRHYHLYDIDNTKGLTFWEYLNPAASAASIKAGGRAVGYGVGVKETMAEFDKNRRSQAKEETCAKLSIGAWSAPRSRLSKEQKREAKVEMDAKAKAKTAKQERAAAAARAEEESQHQNDVDVCTLCATRFLSAGGLARHRNSGCGERMTIIEKEKRKARRSVVRRLESMDELVIEGNKQRIKDLALVTVDLSAPESTAAAVGIEVVDDGGCLVVTAVAGLALGSGLVGEGFVLVSVGGDPASADSIPTELAAGQKATFVFRRPLPNIPIRGSARETIHKEPRFVMPREVEEWLREHAYDHDLGREKMRPYVAYAALKAHFSGCLRNDTKTVMYLERDQVAKWIAEQKKEEKNMRRMKRAAEKMAASSAKATSGTSSSKKAAKAPKKSTKKKAETAASEEENEVSESDDDDMDDEEMGGGAEFHAEW